MGKVYELPRPEKGEIFSYLHFSDVHSEYVDRNALKIALKVFQFIPIKQRRIILNGDILDIKFAYQKCEKFKMHIKHFSWDEYFIPEMMKEVIWFEEFYDLLRRYVLDEKSIYYLLGNHEQRLERKGFIDKCPADLKHNFDLRSALKSDLRKLRVLNYNDWFSIKVNKQPDLHFTHGYYCGMNPIKKHFLDAHCSVMFGHTHETGIQSFKNVGETIIGYNNPCLCETSPEYLEARPQNWSVGFSIINVTEDNYWVQIFNVINNKLILPTGELITP